MMVIGNIKFFYSGKQNIVGRWLLYEEIRYEYNVNG